MIDMHDKDKVIETLKQVITMQQGIINNLSDLMMCHPISLYPAPKPGSIDADGTVTPEKSGGLDHNTAKMIELQDM